METVFSGLSEDTCREIVGAPLWERRGFRWCAQDSIISPAHEADAPHGRRVIWVYRAPWSLIGQASTEESASIGDALADWLARNRATLNSRRYLGKNLLFVNADNVSHADLRAELDPSDPMQDPAPVPARIQAPDDGTIVSKMFEWIAPQYLEVFESLEGACWLPRTEPTFGSGMAPDEHRLFELLELLRNGMELPILRGELEAHKRFQEESSRDDENLRQECELQLLQLHQVQEELEQYYRKNVELLNLVAEEKEGHAKSRHENQALKLQLNDMQEQLNRRHPSPVEPEATAGPMPISGNAFGRPLPVAGSAAGAAVGRGKARANPVSRLARSLARTRLGRRKESNVSATELISIRTSEWFDREWYLETYPDIRLANIDPAEHYFNFGWRESRNPSASFDTDYYLETNRDVAESGLNPLLHFISHGCKEGRRPRRS